MRRKEGRGMANLSGLMPTGRVKKRGESVMRRRSNRDYRLGEHVSRPVTAYEED